MQKQENRKFLLNILGIIVLIFLLAALFLTFISSRLEDIRAQKLYLLKQNHILQTKIERKKAFYAEIEDKIEDIQALIDKDRYHDNRNIRKLLTTISKAQKKLIVDTIPSGYPSLSRRITSSFGYRMHPISHTRKFHHGVDFGGKIGTAIHATADGIVEFSGFNKGGYGNLVVISHNFGFKTAYGHMLEKLPFKSGDFVKKGDIIGYLGNTGRSTGPHLHYEIKFIKRILDPKNFIQATPKHFDKMVKNENRVNWSSLANAILHQLSSQSF